MQSVDIAVIRHRVAVEAYVNSEKFGCADVSFSDMVRLPPSSELDLVSKAESVTPHWHELLEISRS